jgi:hypothetical protein
MSKSLSAIIRRYILLIKLLHIQLMEEQQFYVFHVGFGIKVDFVIRLSPISHRSLTFSYCGHFLYWGEGVRACISCCI